MQFRSLLAAAACAVGIVLGGTASMAQKAGGTLVYIVQPEPPSMASYLSTSGPIGLVAPKIYEGLFDYDKDLKIVPALAASYEVSPDGKTVTFNLQRGVRQQPFLAAPLASYFAMKELVWRLIARV